MSKNMYVDFHVIQTVPPSCVNRDDTGSPKTAIYGGTMRARVSSQAWKKAMRDMFKDLFSSEKLGYRTKNTVKLVAQRIQQNNPEIDEEKAERMSENILEFAGVKPGSDKNSVLFFISSGQIEAIAKLAEEYADQAQVDKKKADKEFKEKVNRALIEEPAVDILLFGRMAASNPSLNYDAAAQVAHSISTHTISNEYDYFTAVDDCGNDDNMGAGHLGTVEFNSSTLYRYATVNVRELSENLKAEELGQAVRGFAEAFVKSMPTGKQNTFANRTLPDLVYATVRYDQPVNLASAFERPIQASEAGYIDRSEKALFAHAKKVYENFIPEPEMSWIVGDCPEYLGKKTTLSELLNNIENCTIEYASDGE